MNANLSNSIKKFLSMESVRKQLYDYFESKQFDLDTIVYPPYVRDMPEYIPMLANKIEIKPHIVDIDPTTNYVKIGWNLFVLGSNRMFLGNSVHESLSHIDVQVADPLFLGEAESLRTPRQITSFITNVMMKHKLGRPGGSQHYDKPALSNSTRLPSADGTTFFQKNRTHSSTI